MTTTRISNTANATSARGGSAKPFNARAARDAAYDAHEQVQGGEGFKQRVDAEPGTISRFHQQLSHWFDASKMVAVPEAGMPALRIVAYEYHSHKPMEAWLDAIPKGGKLKLRVAVCVSRHDKLPFEEFAKTNVYVVSASGPTGRTSVPQFGPGISKQKEYASTSAVLEIDVSKPGDYMIDAYPRGSAGVGGYVEARRIVLHVTGQEPKQA